ncbi:MAG: hypothetical protein ABI367_02665 [Mucilaginibacter sp.]
MKTRVKAFLFLSALLIISCTFNTKFNNQQWQDHSDDGFPPQHRAAMLKDLIENYNSK